MTKPRKPQDSYATRVKRASAMRIASFVVATIGLAPFFSEMAGGNLTLESFYNKPSVAAAGVDGIVVYTGSAGRVLTGLQLHIQSGAPLLISGVNPNTSLPDILAATGVDASRVDASRIMLGYSAENTIGNARETADWARRMNLTNVMIVTSQIHMPRAYLEARTTLPPGVHITPYTVQNSQSLDVVLNEFAKLAGRIYMRSYGEVFNTNASYLAASPSGPADLREAAPTSPTPTPDPTPRRPGPHT